MSELETVPLTCPQIIHVNTFGVDFVRASDDDDHAQSDLQKAMRQETYQKIKSLRAVLKKAPLDLDVVLSMMDDPESKIRWMIVKALANVLCEQEAQADSRVIYALQHLENDHDSKVRTQAMTACRRYRRARTRQRIFMQTHFIRTINSEIHKLKK